MLLAGARGGASGEEINQRLFISHSPDPGAKRVPRWKRMRKSVYACVSARVDAQASATMSE